MTVFLTFSNNLVNRLHYVKKNAVHIAQDTRIGHLDNVQCCFAYLARRILGSGRVHSCNECHPPAKRGLVISSSVEEDFCC